MASNEVYKYRWILLACSTLVCVLTWGISFSVGIYYVRWIEYYDAGKANVAIVGGINTGTSCLLGPIFNVVTHRFGFRVAGASGGLLMVIGLIGSAFAPNLAVLCLFYGFIVGCGSGLSYFAASVAVNCYFTNQRSLAEGIAATGSGMGGFAFSAFGQYLINTYDWRGSMVITGAVCAHLLVLFQLMITPSYLRRFLKLSEWRSKEHGWNEIQANACPVSKENVELTPHNENESGDIDMNPHVEGELEDAVQEAKRKNSWLLRCVILFKNPVFLLIFLSDFFCWLAIYVPYVHLPERARLLGLDLNTISWIASTLSLACTVGRLVISALPDVFNIDVFYLYGALNCLGGVLTILSPLLTTTPGLFVYAGLYGFLNVCTPLVRAGAAKLLGAETFPLAYSWIICAEGIALFIGPALAGLIYDLTLSYDYTFYITGATLLLSGLFPLLQNVALRLQKRQEILPDRNKNSLQHSNSRMN